MVTEDERKNIQKEAQEILKKFSNALEKVLLPKKKASTGIGGFREEESGMIGDVDFRKRMFANASNKDEDYIYAEQKTW